MQQNAERALQEIIQFVKANAGMQVEWYWRDKTFTCCIFGWSPSKKAVLLGIVPDYKIGVSVSWWNHDGVVWAVIPDHNLNYIIVDNLNRITVSNIRQFSAMPLETFVVKGQTPTANKDFDPVTVKDIAILDKIVQQKAALGVNSTMTEALQFANTYVGMQVTWRREDGREIECVVFGYADRRDAVLLGVHQSYSTGIPISDWKGESLIWMVSPDQNLWYFVAYNISALTVGNIRQYTPMSLYTTTTTNTTKNKENLYAPTTTKNKENNAPIRAAIEVLSELNTNYAPSLDTVKRAREAIYNLKKLISK